MLELSSSNTVKRSKIMSSDAYFYVFKHEPMLDEIHLDEALAFEDANNGAKLISAEAIPGTDKFVVFYSLPGWTHRLVMSKYCYLNINYNKVGIEYEMVNAYNGDKVVKAGSTDIRYNTFGKKYLCLDDKDHTRIYLEAIKAL